MQGYLSQAYADSLRDYGEPLWLPVAGGWILQRPIPGTDVSDAMGLYPLFACRNWRGLKADLDALEGRMVSFAAVPDPFGEYDAAVLAAAFRDVVKPFKPHFVIDTSRPMAISRHHRYYARRAAMLLGIECHGSPLLVAGEFDEAYRHLVARHDLSGFKALSPAALAAQLAVPGAVLFLATRNGETVAAQVWYVSGEVAYSHLTALTAAGYALRASYAVYAAAIDTLRTRVRWLDLGGGAGLGSPDDDGLAVFKQGWANDARTAYFCGRILDRQRYAMLAAERPPRFFFPVYRTE